MLRVLMLGLCLFAVLMASAMALVRLSAPPTRVQVHRLEAFDGSKVTPGIDSFGGKGLLARKDFAVGETICTVPLDMCILARRDGVISGLVGQSDASFENFGDLREPTEPSVELQGVTWDLRLAVALLEATSGGSLHKMGQFWDGYTAALPHPLTVCLPFCMQGEVLREVQDKEMIESAKAQQQRLGRLAGTLNDLASHRLTSNVAVPCPTPLAFAFAMVRSRCFQIGDDWFGIVPVIEIANHSSEPNALFAVVGENFDTAACALTAISPIARGTDITISYDASSGKTHDNKRLFQQYGFILEGNVAPSDHIISSDGGEKEERTEANTDADATVGRATGAAFVDAAVELLVDAAIRVLEIGPSFLKPRVSSTASSLGAVIRSNQVSSKGFDSVGSVLASLAERIAVLASEVNQQTTLEEDEKLLHRLLHQPSAAFVTKDEIESGTTGLNREQCMACLRYRIDRKCTILCAARLVELALQSMNNQNET